MRKIVLVDSLDESGDLTDRNESAEVKEEICERKCGGKFFGAFYGDLKHS